VNSYAKAFGELIESRRHTPSLSADQVAALIASGAIIKILDVRRFDEYATMNIPGSISVPGAELVLRAGRIAPNPETTIIVNCAGRTRSIIGTQSLINAGVANKVLALRNGTIARWPKTTRVSRCLVWSIRS
jgi:rhodanese-related sulfurtransferase